MCCEGSKQHRSLVRIGPPLGIEVIQNVGQVVKSAASVLPWRFDGVRNFHRLYVIPLNDCSMNLWLERQILRYWLGGTCNSP